MLDIIIHIHIPLFVICEWLIKTDHNSNQEIPIYETILLSTC